MPILVRWRRVLANITLVLTGWERIEHIPTDVFNGIVKDCVARGWRKTYEYDGIDAWIDYGRVELEKNGETLRCEWTNWFEGEITGRRHVIRQLSETYRLTRRP